MKRNIEKACEEKKIQRNNPGRNIEKKESWWGRGEGAMIEEKGEIVRMERND